MIPANYLILFGTDVKWRLDLTWPCRDPCFRLTLWHYLRHYELEVDWHRDVEGYILADLEGCLPYLPVLLIPGVYCLGSP